jgi:hypothetical protein
MRSRATGRRADANWVNSMAAVPSTLDMVVFDLPSLPPRLRRSVRHRTYRAGRLHNQPSADFWLGRAAHGAAAVKTRFFSDARAPPPPISGLMTSSSTATL